MMPDYEPHRVCLLYDPRIIAFHVLGDLAIAAAYFAIPAALWYFTRKRRDCPFRGIIVWFGLFILGCGLTHVGNALEIWLPIYGLTGMLKAGTAIVSLITLRQLVPIIPQALRLPNLSELERLRQWMQRPIQDQIPAMVNELDRITAVLSHFAAGRRREDC